MLKLSELVLIWVQNLLKLDVKPSELVLVTKKCFARFAALQSIEIVGFCAKSAQICIKRP